MVPVGGICPQMGAFLWAQRRIVAACPHRGCFLWKFGAGDDFCPHRGCLVWMYGARRWHLSTDGGIFVDAEEIPGETGNVSKMCKKKGSRTYSEAFSVTRQGILELFNGM